MRILAIDIGNTRSKFALYLGNKLLRASQLPSSPIPTLTRVRNQLRRIIGGQNSAHHGLDGVVISSVVPALTKRLSRILHDDFGIKPIVVSSDLETGIQLRYKSARTLGADRICGAVAAFDRYKGPVIVIDLGTAITFNVVTKSGVFLGGAIAPGIQTAAAQLRRRTAQLPEVPLQFPPSVIGRSTQECIQSGILYGSVGVIEGMVRRFREKTGTKSAIILTGGGAPLLKGKLTFRHTVVPSLVLDGARLIGKRTIATRQQAGKRNGMSNSSSR